MLQIILCPSLPPSLQGVKVQKECLLSFFILNCHYCLDGTQSCYFGCAPPRLEEYLPLDEELHPPPAVDLGDVWDFHATVLHNDI